MVQTQANQLQNGLQQIWNRGIFGGERLTSKYDGSIVAVGMTLCFARICVKQGGGAG